MLFWHADLYHGGSNVIDEGLTRNSLVGHYCPSNAEPNFFKFANRNVYSLPDSQSTYSSEYY